MAFYQVMTSENPGLWWLTPLSTYFSYIVVRKSKMTSTVEYNFQFTISLYAKITNVFSKLSKLIKPNSAWMVIAMCKVCTFGSYRQSTMAAALRHILI
jgi:glutaredoxin 2